MLVSTLPVLNPYESTAERAVCRACEDVASSVSRPLWHPKLRSVNVVHVSHQGPNGCVVQAVCQAEDRGDKLNSTIREMASTVFVCALVLDFCVGLALDSLEDVDGCLADCFFGLVCASFAWNGGSRNAYTLHLWCFSVFAVFAVFAHLLEPGEFLAAVLAKAVVNVRLPNHAEDVMTVNASLYTVVAEVAPFAAVSRDDFTLLSCRLCCRKRYNMRLFLVIENSGAKLYKQDCVCSFVQLEFVMPAI
jgi:hypothetical protein